MKISRIREDILDAVRNRFDVEYDDDSQDQNIEKLSAEELFIEYCERHGLIGWGRTLIGVLDSLRMAEQE